MWPFQKQKKNEVKAKKGYYMAAKDKIDEREIEILASKVRWALQDAANKEIIFLCIGTDRSTGDSLGPLVGTMLKKEKIPYPIYGTLEEPVHALNLEKVLKEIYKTHDDPVVFGIDACLGDEHQIGFILFKEEPFIPGNALNKALPQVGDLHLRAIVNYLDPLSPAQSLNNTRLYTVINLAKAITKIIIKTVSVEKISLT